MPVMSSWLKRPWPRVVSVVALVAGLFCVAASWPKASGQTSRAGRVVGAIDGFSYDGGQFHVVGWACQQGNPASVVATEIVVSPLVTDATSPAQGMVAQ